VPIGDHTADEHEQHDGQLSEKLVDAQVEVRLGHRKDEPALRVGLHPGADGRSERGEPEKPVVAMRQGAGHAVQPGTRRLEFSRGRGRGREGSHGWVSILKGERVKPRLLIALFILVYTSVR